MTKLSFRFLLAALILVLTAAPSFAQQMAPPASSSNGAEGRIVGRVVDAETGAGLSAVTIQVVGTTTGAISSIDGRYLIQRVPAGPVTLRIQMLGYGIKTVTGVQVRGDGATELNIALEQAAVEIAAIEVTAAAERGSVNRALDAQRTAVGMVNAVTAEQISKSPDSDAAAAVQRVAGVTLMDNKFVQVRGLGQRYTTTSMNGARIPSPEPEKRLVPLDLFPAGLIESITTSKTFTPDQPGDFSGASVDIKTREFFGERRQAFSATIGLNSLASRADVGPSRTGLEWLGFGTGDRSLPADLAAAGRFDRAPSQSDINSFVSGFRNAWSPGSSASTPNTSLGASSSGSGRVFGRQLGYVLTGTYSHGQEVRDNEIRALAQPDEQGNTREIDRYEGVTARSSVLWGGVMNANALIGSHARLGLSATYNRSADNEARRESGTSENYGGLPLDITRLRYVERSVGSLQLVGAHEPADGQRIDWSVTGSRVTRAEPDRSEVVYATERDPRTNQLQAPAWFSTSGEAAVRTWGDLSEMAFDAAGSYRLALGSDRQNVLKVGGLFRITERDADNRVYSITAPTMTRADRELTPEQIFDGRFSTEGSNVFRIAPLSQGGSYTAADRLGAAYAMVEWAATPRLRVTTGVRLETSHVDVVAEPTVGAAVRTQPSFTDLLPGLTVNYQLSEQQTLRFSVSQTLSRPEYRELAQVQYRDVLGGDNIIGNPELKRTLIRNLDMRWERYPNPGEVVSIALFAKQFDNPIESVYLGTSGTRVITFLNAEGAYNYGVELEARKSLGFISQPLDAVMAFTNATIMKSEIEIGDAASGASKIGEQRAMVGQAPYVLNAGLTFAPDNGLSATLLYNIVGKRIVNAAERPLPDVYEQPRHGLDLAIRMPAFRTLTARLDVKNVLDSPYEITQGAAIRESYRAGRVVALGLSWRK